MYLLPCVSRLGLAFSEQCTEWKKSTQIITIGFNEQISSSGEGAMEICGAGIPDRRNCSAVNGATNLNLFECVQYACADVRAHVCTEQFVIIRKAYGGSVVPSAITHSGCWFSHGDSTRLRHLNCRF